MTFDSDWLFLSEALPDLRDYILSSDVYWPLRTPKAGGLKLPQLTIGNLLLSQARLGAIGLTCQQEAELAEISRCIDGIRQEWRANWDIKAGREFGSRMNLWQQFLQELRSDPRRNARTYSQEVHQRVILRLLRSEITNLASGQAEKLEVMDRVLRGLSQPGPFVWEAQLANSFPQEDFWFLYIMFTVQAR